MRILDVPTDGGTDTDADRHHECRVCGTNLSADAQECPDCGGEVAVDTF
jgi:rubrerythrin